MEENKFADYLSRVGDSDDWKKCLQKLGVLDVAHMMWIDLLTYKILFNFCYAVSNEGQFEPGYMLLSSGK